jgi:hypothetical protein
MKNIFLVGFAFFFFFTMTAQAADLATLSGLKGSKLTWFQSGTNADIKTWEARSKNVVAAKGLDGFYQGLLKLPAWKVEGSSESETFHGGPGVPASCSDADSEYSTRLRAELGKSNFEIQLPDDFSTPMKTKKSDSWIVRVEVKGKANHFCVEHAKVQQLIEESRKEHDVLNQWLL